MASETFKLPEGNIEVVIDSGSLKNTNVNGNKRSLQQTLSNLISNPHFKQWAQTRGENLRSWGDFINPSRFHPPKNIRQGSQRLITNIEHFQSNYLAVFCIIFIYCLITNPALFVVLLASLGACYLIYLRSMSGNYSILGFHIKLTHQYTVIGVLGLLILLQLGATSIFFWIFGFTIFVVVLHGFLFAPLEESSSETNII